MRVQYKSVRFFVYYFFYISFDLIRIVLRIVRCERRAPGSCLIRAKRSGSFGRCWRRLITMRRLGKAKKGNFYALVVMKKVRLEV